MILVEEKIVQEMLIIIIIIEVSLSLYLRLTGRALHLTFLVKVLSKGEKSKGVCTRRLPLFTRSSPFSKSFHKPSPIWNLSPKSKYQTSKEPRHSYRDKRFGKLKTPDPNKQISQPLEFFFMCQENICPKIISSTRLH